MNPLAIPELRSLESPTSILRIPSEIDVPVTSRILRLIDTSAFQRLKRISQLGLVSQVYPGANHTRFEHSLGVYRNSLLFLKRLMSLDTFSSAVTPKDVELLIVAGLLHDLGHWPFCHAIEDMRLTSVTHHESLARQFLQQDELAQAIDGDWQFTAEELIELLAPSDKANPRFPLLGSILSGPIDIDKLDYLDRDSLHAGVPYGRNFDRNRLISQLCVGPDGCSLAITDKARTAAEMMVFARYVMFSEVYWHHAVRSATAMLQRAVWELIGVPLQTRADLPTVEAWQQATEPELIDRLRMQAKGTTAAPLLDGLFGRHRSLYKRLVEFHTLQAPALHLAMARRPYEVLVELGNRLAERVAAEAGIEIHATELLIDAPPVKLEVQFNVQVQQSSGRFLTLGELSPVASTLAKDQFDNLVKRVRIFVAPHLRQPLCRIDIEPIIHRLLESPPE